MFIVYDIFNCFIYYYIHQFYSGFFMWMSGLLGVWSRRCRSLGAGVLDLSSELSKKNSSLLTVAPCLSYCLSMLVLFFIPFVFHIIVLLLISGSPILMWFRPRFVFDLLRLSYKFLLEDWKQLATIWKHKWVKIAFWSNMNPLTYTCSLQLKRQSRGAGLGYSFTWHDTNWTSRPVF